LGKDEGAVRERYRRFLVRLLLIGFLALFAATLFFRDGLHPPRALGLGWLEFVLGRQFKQPFSEPVAATLAALATSLTASTSTSAIEARFFCAIFKAS